MCYYLNAQFQGQRVKMGLKEKDRSAYNGYIMLWMGSGDGQSWTRTEIWGISWLAKELLAFQEWLRCMEFASKNQFLSRVFF